MDRNTLIGFVLIALIILLMPKYTEWISGGRRVEKTPQVPSKTAQPSGISPATPQEAPQTPQAAAESLSVEEPEALVAEAPAPTPFVARTVVIENSVFKGEISTRGGVIQKWYLKDFRAGVPKGEDADAGPVQLIHPEGQGLALLWDDRREIRDLASVEFVPDRDSLIVLGDQPGTVTFTADLGDGRRIEKQLVIKPDAYAIGLSLATQGFDENDRMLVGWQGRLGDTEGNPTANIRYAQVCTYAGGEVKRYNLGKKALRDGVTSSAGGWVGVRNKYFLVALVPDQQTQWEAEISLGESEGEKLKDLELYIAGDEQAVGHSEMLVYLGPIQHDRLVGLGLGLEQAMDLGWPVVRHIARAMLPLFLGLYKVFPNYGLVIIIFSVLVKVIVYPLTHKSYAATAKMQKLQPEMTALREQYKDNPQELNRQTMKLMVSIKLTDLTLSKLPQENVPTDVINRLKSLVNIERVGEKAFSTALEETLGKQKANRYRAAILKHAKKSRMNPMGGCLPMLVQMPVFFALYQVLTTTIELRQAEFVWWVTDLSQPDPWRVLPILMGLTSFVQQKMMTKDPKQKAMIYIMPVFMTFIFMRFAAGLVLYWTMFNVLSMAQQALMEMRKRSEPQAV